MKIGIFSRKKNILILQKNGFLLVKNDITENGSIYISCTQHNIGEILIEAKKLGFKLNNILTWYKVNAMPNITKRTYTHSTGFVCWFVKEKIGFLIMMK